MSSINRFNRFLVVLAFAICASAVVAAQDQTEPTPQIVTAKIRLDDLSMMIVPVSINGAGPYDFVLDTGSSKTIVNRKLSEKLGLSLLGDNNFVGALATTRMSVVRVNSLTVAGATVQGGEIFSSDRPATVNGKVRGVLGEDFLRNFDVLIDYRHQSIRLEPPLGSMAQTATGEHLPLQLTGTYHGKLTYDRLVISGRMQEFGDATCLCFWTPAQTSLPSSGTALVRGQVRMYRQRLETSIGGLFRCRRPAKSALSIWEAPRSGTSLQSPSPAGPASTRMVWSPPRSSIPFSSAAMEGLSS